MQTKHNQRLIRKNFQFYYWKRISSLFVFLCSGVLFPTTNSIANDLVVPQSLVNEINQSYVARAIIGLKVDNVQPEGDLASTAAVDEQRNDIAQTRNSFLQELTQSVWGELNSIGGVSQASTIQAEVEFTTIPYLVLNVDEWMLAKIKESSKVASIQLDEMIPLSLSQSVPLIGADKAWAKGYSGSNYAVAVLDTGVDKNHAMLSSNKVIAEACYSTTSSQTQTVCPNGTNSQIGTGAGVPCSSSLTGYYHGTHVAGIAAGNSSLAGVAKGANIVAVQVFSRYGSSVTAWTSDIIKGLEYVLSLHKNNTRIAAVNMSLGTSAVYSTSCDATQSATKAAIDNLKSVGIATIIASGNSSSASGVSSPGCISSAISVGATDKSDVVASYSNSASILKLLAPGSSITSSMPGGSTSALNGTSMAAPHVAGAFAVLKAALPTATVDQILSCLETTGKPIKDGRNGITKPRIQVDAALSCLIPTPNIIGSPTSLNFGNVNVDSLSSAQTVTLTNTGNAVLNVGAMNVSSTEFTIQNNNCANKAVAASGNCIFQVVFAPTLAGNKSASVSISSNDPDTANLIIGLTGNGIASCSVTSSAGIGGTISPLGTTKALVCGSNQAYSIVPNANYKVANVLVNNSSVGAVSSYLLNCNCSTGKNVTHTIAASFAPLVPNITITPTSANFGQVLVNNTSSAQSFTISNTGDANLQLGSISVSNSDFILTDSCSNKAVAPKATCSVSVAFKPQAEGAKTGNLSIASNDPDTATLSVPLQGEGKKGVPVLGVSPLSIDFGDVEVGKSSASKIITVTNTGTAVLYVAGVTTSGTNAADFTIVNNGCMYKTLIPSQSCTVEIQFKPGTEGSKSAEIKVVSSNAGTSIISLIGKGVIPPTEACSEKPTITSKATGSWSSSSSWVEGRVPNTNDVVLIKKDHNITLPSYYASNRVAVKGVCNHGTLWSGTSWWSYYGYSYYFSFSWLHGTSFIDNYGQIRGINSINALFAAGGYLYLTTDGELKNYPNAVIKGGDAGNYSWYGYNYGGSGGGVYVYARTITNYGTYGTPSYGAILGGKGGNGSYAGGWGGYAYAIAYGGYLRNGGIICSGDGGDGGTWAGGAGWAYVNGVPYTLLNGGTVCSGKNGKGTVRIDPSVISLSGKDTKIEGSDVVIFGGKDFVIDLSDMSEGAISAETLTLAVGEGGIIDLRGSNAKVLNVTGELKIFSDNIMLDEGVTIEDVVKAGKITVAPAKVLYDMGISGSEVIVGKVNETLAAKVFVTNTGPETDIYTINISNSKGWDLGTLPSKLTVESQQVGSLDFNVSLPSTEGQNTVVITITSQGDPTVSKTFEMQVHAATEIKELVVTDNGTVDTSLITDDLSKGGDTSKGDENGDLIGIQPVGKYSITGTVKDASGNPVSGVTITAGKQTSVTDDAGKWSIGGLENGNYTLSASKEGYMISSKDLVIDGKDVSLTLEAIIGKYTAKGVLKDKSGKALVGVSVTINGKTTTTDVNGNWSIGGLPEGKYDMLAKLDNFLCSNPYFEVGNEQYQQNVSCSPLSALKVSVKADRWQSIPQGGDLSYIVTVMNGGQQTATNVVLQNILSGNGFQKTNNFEVISFETLDGGVCDTKALSCNLPDLKAGETARVKLKVKALRGGDIRNTATLTSNEYPVDKRSNSANGVSPYFSVKLIGSPNPIAMMSTLNYKGIIELGPHAPNKTASNIVLTLRFPLGTRLVDFKPADSSVVCDISNYPEVKCTVGDLSIESAVSINRRMFEANIKLTEPSLLALVAEGELTANGQAKHSETESTPVFLPADAKVDAILIFDTTESMREEHKANVAAITALIKQAESDPNLPPLSVALVVFKDDVRLVNVYTDLKALKKAIESLTIGGGGACPEAGAEALTLALNHIKDGGFVFMATDAPYYEKTDKQALKDRVEEYMSKKGVKFMLSISEQCSVKQVWNGLSTK